MRAWWSGLRAELTTIQHYVAIGDAVPDWAVRYETFLESGSRYRSAIATQARRRDALMYTSGTTGRPKGAMITHEAMIALCECLGHELAADLGDRILLSMPFFHIGARSQGCAVTCRGGTLVVHRAFDARRSPNSRARAHHATHLAPTLLQAVLDLPDIDRYDLSLPSNTLNYAAAPMPLTVLKRAMKRFGPILINGYGQTEGSGTTLRKSLLIGRRVPRRISSG